MRYIKVLYLFDAALGDAKHVDDISWYQYHGRQSHQPADHLTPQRVHILPQGQRGHLNGTEGKHPLQYTIMLFHLCNLWCPWCLNESTVMLVAASRYVPTVLCPLVLCSPRIICSPGPIIPCSI